MEKNIFELNNSQLREIISSFQEKFERGLQEEDTEIQCLPTYISPNTSDITGRALVLDLGGTNYRAAIVDFLDGEPEIRPRDGWKKKLDVMKTDGFTREQLFKEQADLISEIDHNQELPIGYCFSYPAESLLNGDAKLIRWTKGVDILEMIGQPVGAPLMEYLNDKGIARFTDIKVINDTVASLFAGLSSKGYHAYIGLIVGTGTNMATFVPKENIKKINPEYKGEGWIPVNLESGNFYPPHLTQYDEEVDRNSDSLHRQRFEKAVSGLYLGEIFKTIFPSEHFKHDLNAWDLNNIVNNPDLYKSEYVSAATWIFQRSAKLVAASLTGLIIKLISYTPSVRSICLIAEGSVFWSKMYKSKNYSELVMETLTDLLNELGYDYVDVKLEEKKNINLVGTAIAALS